jgi:hypothetical protein
MTKPGTALICLPLISAVSTRPQLTLPKFRRTGSRRSRGSPSPSADYGGNYSIASSGELPLSVASTQRGESIPLDTFSAFNPNMLSVSAQQFPPGSRRTSTTPSVRSNAREPSASNSRDAYASSRENTQSPIMIAHSVSGHSIGGTQGEIHFSHFSRFFPRDLNDTQ